jgi:hypothetical protein
MHWIRAGCELTAVVNMGSTVSTCAELTSEVQQSGPDTSLAESATLKVPAGRVAPGTVEVGLHNTCTPHFVGLVGSMKVGQRQQQ